MAAGGAEAGLINQRHIITGIVVIAVLVIGLVISNVVYAMGVHIQETFAQALNKTVQEIELIPTSNVQNLLASNYTLLAVAALAGFVALMIYYLLGAVRSTQAATAGLT